MHDRSVLFNGKTVKTVYKHCLFSNHLFPSLSLSLYLYLSFSLSLYLSICRSIYICISVYLSLCLSPSLSLFLSLTLFCLSNNPKLARHNKELQAMLKPGGTYGEGDEALEFYAKHTAQIEVSAVC